MIFSAAHINLRYRALSLDADLLAQHTQVQTEDTSNVPKHIYIQWFLDVPISLQILDSQNWTISNTEASYLQQSAQPGESGNIIISLVL